MYEFDPDRRGLQLRLEFLSLRFLLCGLMDDEFYVYFPIFLKIIFYVLYMIQPTISLEMAVPTQAHCGFPSFLAVDWFCLFAYLWVLPFPLEDCSEFANCVIIFIYKLSLPGGIVKFLEFRKL